MEPKQEVNYTELLEKEFGQDPVAMSIVEGCRKLGLSDKEAFSTLKSFY